MYLLPVILVLGCLDFLFVGGGRVVSMHFNACNDNTSR